MDDTISNAGEAAAEAGGGGGDDARDAARDAPPDPYLEMLVLQPDFEAVGRSQYSLAELAAYHDRQFVEGVYRAILARAPLQAEGARDLDELRGGRVSKVEIIERLLESPEARAAAGAGRGVRVEGLPSPALRRLSRLPVVGYLLRLVRALVRLPAQTQHQQQFEVYALAQQQLIADYINRAPGPSSTHGWAAAAAAGAEDHAPASYGAPPQGGDVVETMEMFSDALLELSNNHAELEARTRTQVEQAQAALAELTAAITAQQQLAGTLRREQQLAADAQQEFLVQEQRAIVETQQLVLEELRAELRELSARQQSERAAFDAELHRLRSLREGTETARASVPGQA